MDPTSAAGGWMAWAQGISPYAPRLLGAVAIALAAWIGAGLARLAIRRLAEHQRLDERLHNPGLAKVLGDLASLFVWLLALPALLGALALEGLVAPINAMLSKLLAFLPQMLGAALIVAVGLLLARIVARLASGALKAAGADALGARLGLARLPGDQGLSDLVGRAVFALVLLPVVGAAVQALGLEVIARPVSQVLDALAGMIPRVLAAAVILLIAVVVGRLLGNLATGFLSALGARDLARHLGLPEDARPGGRDLAEWGGVAVSAAVLVLALAQASEALGFGTLTHAVTVVGAAMGQVLVALVVMAVGAWLANLLAAMVRAGRSPQAARWAAVVRGAVLFFAAALALRQAGLPAEIVTLAFGAAVVGIALALALAFGLGGRGAAARWLARLEPKAQDVTPTPPRRPAAEPPAGPPDEPGPPQ